jgi:DNA-binding protein Fis
VRIEKHGLLQAVGPVLLPEHLPPSLQSKVKESVTASGRCFDSATSSERFIKERLNTDSTDLYTEWLGIAEKELLVIVLRHADGNLTKAAKILGLHRATLRNKLKAVKLDLDDKDRESEG